MTPLARAMAACALAHLALAGAAGAVLLTHSAVWIDADLRRWIPAHVESMLCGWLLQFMLAVGYWILPRRGDSHQRGRRGWAVAGVLLLNGGVLLVWVSAGAGRSELLTLARALQAAGMALLAWHFWPRVRPPFGAAQAARRGDDAPDGSIS